MRSTARDARSVAIEAHRVANLSLTQTTAGDNASVLKILFDVAVPGNYMLSSHAVAQHDAATGDSIYIRPVLDGAVIYELNNEAAYLADVWEFVHFSRQSVKYMRPGPHVFGLWVWVNASGKYTLYDSAISVMEL